MGTLVPPLRGDVYVDANVIIYRIERVALYLQVAAPLWDALDSGAQTVVTNDPAFRRVPGLPVVVLSEVAATP